ncbi:ribosome small subunit-dependent GTPase A [Ichthyobacterium seriolicida]|uniref:Small ribosomal subunit biogenesis GTPase RsgA n=1 Tax=Ichthyobacterium seriolicida TaxID=242600 RepID=A0A1J1E7Q4_9FLAO|nr:ribosome small subunit-dependent GTPase A [Ichthyobacterium seriolicida]BAV95366.1 ribosome small subunit-stimulated GTPase EngC [Ichthyobacterium seriolicida]
MKGIIVKSTGTWYKARLDSGNIIECRIRGKFKIKNIKSTNPVAVGDKVEIKIDQDQSAVITSIEDRKNYIIRKSVNLSKRTHIIASNIDTIFLVITMIEPKTLITFIDRVLVNAQAYGIDVILLFNKIDLYDENIKMEMKKYIDMYSNIGYQCLYISCKDGTNIESLKDMMKDKTNIFVGNSGVGKSTIVNAIDNNINLKTDNISKSHKLGKHTTTFAEMFELNFGGFIIDTPGIKSFSSVDIEKNELGHYFPEIFKISKSCKFYNCLHIKEPGCAVLSALDKEEIHFSRYKSYLNILNEDDHNYR